MKKNSIEITINFADIKRLSIFLIYTTSLFSITSNLAPRVGNALNWKVAMHVVQKILILIDIFKKGYN